MWRPKTSSRVSAVLSSGFLRHLSHWPEARPAGQQDSQVSTFLVLGIKATASPWISELENFILM